MTEVETESLSVTSFMSTLLCECSEKLCIHPAELVVDIVDDPAKSELPPREVASRRNSLVTMIPQKSERQLSRWSNEFEKLHNSPRRFYFGKQQLGEEDSEAFVRQGLLHKSGSETEMLVPPKRCASPSRMSRRPTVPLTSRSRKQMRGLH